MKRIFLTLPARLLLGVAVLGPFMVATPAIAQQAPASNDQEGKDQSTLLYDAGIKAAKESRLSDAQAYLLGAWRIRRHWQIAANLGDVELALGKYRDAAEHLEYSLRTADSMSEEDRKAVQDMLARARAHVGELTVRVNVVGAEIIVDGAPVGTSPLNFPIYVAPGRVVVEARLRGFSPALVKQDVAVGSAKLVELRLDALKASAPVAGPRPNEIRISDSRQTGPSRGVLVAGGAVSALAIGAGAAMWIIATETLDNDKKSAQGLANAAAASMGAGGIVGLGTILYAILQSKPVPNRGVEAGLTITPKTGGVVVGARW